MISGVLYALLAGMLWGLIFVGPLIVPDYPAALQSTGRYLALGIIALPLAWLGRQRLRQLTQKDWLTALALTMMGNLIYYVCLASAIQRTGAPVSTMIIAPCRLLSRYVQICSTASVTANAPGTASPRRCSVLRQDWPASILPNCTAACRISPGGAMAPALPLRWFPSPAGRGMRCVTPAGCGKTRTRTR
jgi:hypothetical protein